MLTDPRILQFASNLVNFSCAVKPGEHVLIDVSDIPEAMTAALIRKVHAAGGHPHLNIRNNALTAVLLETASKDQLEARAAYEMNRMEKMDAYIAIRGSHNVYETSHVKAELRSLFDKILDPIIDYRVNNTKWVIAIWPTPAAAQMAGMSTEAFTKFYFDVCTFDYTKYGKGMEALRKRMANADKVRLIAKDTDLRFSIKGIGAEACGGKHNIPDGEVFSCPVKNSVEGVISFNAPTIYDGEAFDNIRLVFSEGKIIEATGSNTERINALLDTDAGARYVGEFAIGFNPFIRKPMRDILFDEKITGSLHVTPGSAYETAGNGNKSAIHWDMVLMQTPEYGGGEIWFDGELIRKDGLFVPKDLQPLNPENLLKA